MNSTIAFYPTECIGPELGRCRTQHVARVHVRSANWLYLKIGHYDVCTKYDIWCDLLFGITRCYIYSL